jgi:hypothetical protein
MRTRRTRRLALVVGLVAVAGTIARPAWGQDFARSLSRFASAEPDPFRPYSSRARTDAGPVARPYLRTQPTTPAPPPRVVAPPRGVHDYFPGMRPGIHPNRNTVDPRRLCVPGRRAFLMR